MLCMKFQNHYYKFTLQTKKKTLVFVNFFLNGQMDMDSFASKARYKNVMMYIWRDSSERLRRSIKRPKIIHRNKITPHPHKTEKYQKSIRTQILSSDTFVWKCIFNMSITTERMLLTERISNRESILLVSLLFFLSSGTFQPLGFFLWSFGCDKMFNKNEFQTRKKKELNVC